MILRVILLRIHPLTTADECSSRRFLRSINDINKKHKTQGPKANRERNPQASAVWGYIYFVTFLVTKIDTSCTMKLKLACLSDGAVQCDLGKSRHHLS